MLAEDSPFTRALAKRFDQAPRAFLILSFDQPNRIKSEERISLLKSFVHPERVEISDDLRSMLLLLENIAAKVQVLNERESNRSSAPPQATPLEQFKGLSAAADLRLDNGRLSAAAIARLFGLSLNALAQFLGRTRQALSKTPDAGSIQDGLACFERIARLRSVLSNDAQFRKWLRTPNPDLGGQPPLHWIERKKCQPLARLVDNTLTGAQV